MITEFSGDIIQWLRGFYCTVQTGSMSAASAIMKRNQSALSHQIKCLEDELGVKLFKGAKAKRELTAEGKFLLEKCIYIFDTINALRNTIGSLPARLEGEIPITAVFSLTQYFLPEVIASFSQKYPGVQLLLNGEVETSTVCEQVKSRSYDIGLFCTDSPPQDFSVIKLFTTEVMCLSPKNGPYALPTLPSLEQFAALPHIYPPEGSSMYQFITRQFARHGLQINTKYMVSHFEAAKAYVRCGMGLTFVDAFACSEFDRQNTNVLSTALYFPNRSVCLIRRRDAFVPPHLDVFIKMLAAKAHSKDIKTLFLDKEALFPCAEDDAL